MKRVQRGFTIVEILLALLVVAALAFGGYYVWHTHQTTKPANTSSNQTTKSTASTTKSSQFVFKELGVQITLPDSLKDLSYRVENLKNDQGGTSTVLYLATLSMGDANGQCYNQQKLYANTPGGFGAIDKIDGQYSPSTAGPTQDPPLKQFDKFYIEGSQPNGITTCSNPNVDPGLAQSEAGKLFKALTEAFKTATLIQ